MSEFSHVIRIPSAATYALLIRLALAPRPNSNYPLLRLRVRFGSAVAAGSSATDISYRYLSLELRRMAKR